ncbi:MAG: amidase [Propionibacteriaceae bacterium]|jgi:aspartyl-tRNA(Asn)/glutamyl-tRNA(Gln) amidotransferase subunit A|nr:amidase [Propionibacteriaceae bacterium]
MSDYLTISDALDALRDNKITATELVQDAFAAADAVDSELGIYLARFDEQALAAAAEADRIYAAGDPAGALLGIPLGIKDIISTLEGETTAQSLVLDREWGAAIGDAVVTARLRAAGGVITGKLTTMEYATGVPDPTKPFPIPKNPWNTDYWTGGSSSGTGSGVASGAILGGLGTDTGGSIRIPAAFCGISGLKATFGRVPKSGCVPLGYSLDNIGPMARSARDCALMLNVLAGYDASDPCAAEQPVEDYVAGLTGDLSGLTIGLDRLALVYADRDPAIDPAIDAAVKALTALGAKVVDVTLPLWDELSAATRITSRSEAFAYHAPDLQSRWDDYFEATRQGVGAAVAFSGADYVQAQRVRRVGQKALAALFETVDLVITPTSSVAGWSLDELGSMTERFLAMHTGYFNAVGNPALVVPMGFNDIGLPLSLQVVGRPFDETTVLRAGDAFQRVSDFHLAVPPMMSSVAVA